MLGKRILAGAEQEDLVGDWANGRAPQGLADGLGKKGGHFRLAAQARFGLGRVSVRIQLTGWHLDDERGDRMASPGEQRTIGGFDRGAQSATSDPTTVDDQGDVVPAWTGDPTVAQVASHGNKISLSRWQRQQGCRDGRAINLPHDDGELAASAGAKRQPPVEKEREAYRGVGQRVAANELTDEERLRPAVRQKLAAGRHAGEEIANAHRRAAL